MIWMVKYLEDIIGKGLEFHIILEMIARGALNQIPFSLPLAILLSSTMTYGKLGENIELTAMKSLGVSLIKVMRPLFFFCILVVIGAFYFSNNYLPYSNKKLSSLVGDIRKSKPELLIPEGVFYSQLKGYTLRIGKKYKDKTIADVLIFDDSKNGQGGFIASDSGNLELSKSGKHLILNLIDGNTYKRDSEKIRPGKMRKLPFVRNHFDNNRIIFDLSSFKFEKSNPNNRGKSFKNIPVNEIILSRDSVELDRNESLNKFVERQHYKYYFRPDTTFLSDTLSSGNYDSLMYKINNCDSLKRRIIFKTAKGQSAQAANRINNYSTTFNNQRKYASQHTTEINKRYSMAIACLVMFFIGAPFGAIVRKGGLGLPVVIGVILFLVYYVISTSMEKLCKKGDFNPVIGMWFAPIILTPIGIFLTYKASTDSALFRWEAYKKGIKRLFKLNNH
tara:strand:+ start:5157 stop:6500 length:1344 start_codon:yes stop_codon:yes gene_type:complete